MQGAIVLDQVQQEYLLVQLGERTSNETNPGMSAEPNSSGVTGVPVLHASRGTRQMMTGAAVPVSDLKPCRGAVCMVQSVCLRTTASSGFPDRKVKVQGIG